MTLGSSPQPPLTRRQERELARQQALHSTGDDLQPSSGERSAASAEPAGIEPAGKPESSPAGKPESSPAGKPESSPAGKPEIKPVSVFAPRAAEPEPARMTTASARSQDPERTLTRRQLREIKAAESGEVRPEDAEGLAPDAETHTTGGLNPPVGHWSLGRGDDEQAPTINPGQTFDQFMSRGTGGSGSPTTTSALILPSIPQQGSSSGPLTSTGEILITGSYDLPRSLGATGHHPGNFDSADMDQTDDHDDAGGYNSTVAPVSASRAVSTHASNRGLVAPPQKSGNSLPTVLAVTAAVLAVGVLALFVFGYILNIF